MFDIIFDSTYRRGENINMPAIERMCRLLLAEGFLTSKEIQKRAKIRSDPFWKMVKILSHSILVVDGIEYRLGEEDTFCLVRTVCLSEYEKDPQVPYKLTTPVDLSII